MRSWRVRALPLDSEDAESAAEARLHSYEVHVVKQIGCRLHEQSLYQGPSDDQLREKGYTYCNNVLHQPYTGKFSRVLIFTVFVDQGKTANFFKLTPTYTTYGS